MNTLFLAALLATVPAAAEAEVLVSFTHAADSDAPEFTGMLTIDPALLGPNQAAAPDTSYASGSSLFAVTLTSSGTTYTLAGSPAGGDLSSNDAGGQFNQYADDGSGAGSSFTLFNADYSPTVSTAAFGNVLLPDLRALPNLYVSFSSGGAVFNGAVTVSYADAAAALPEPASWAMMICGFGLVGHAMRRRQRAIFVAA